jgi:paraquat-inducible protein A
VFNEPAADLALVACPHCDLLQRLPSPASHPKLAPGASARCPRCDAELWRPRTDSLNRTLALTVAALILYVVANTFPMLGLTAVGHQASTTVLGGAHQLWVDGRVIVAVVLFTASSLPASIGLVLAIVVGARRE